MPGPLREAREARRRILGASPFTTRLRSLFLTETSGQARLAARLSPPNCQLRANCRYMLDALPTASELSIDAN